MGRLREIWKSLGLALLIVLPGCGGSGPVGVTDPQNMEPNAGDVVHQPGGGITRFVAHNVIYRIDSNIVAQMPNLDADMVVHDPGMPWVPGNINDFDIQVHTGTIIKGPNSMAHLLNDYVFNYPGCPISNVSVQLTPGRVSMSGSMKEGPISVPFSMGGTVSPDGMGHILMHVDSVSALGVPVAAGLIGLTGVEGTINAHADKGMTMNGDDVTLNVGKMLPLPRLHGFVSGVEVMTNALQIEFDDGVHRPLPPLPQPNARNWILIWGGDVLINTTLLKNAKLEEVDTTPQDPMYYYLPAYLAQLQAGFVVSNLDGSMVAYVPDVHGTTVPQGPFNPATFLPGQ